MKELRISRIDMSEIAICNLPASARSKKAISEHAQEHAPGFSPAVLDSNEPVNAADKVSMAAAGAFVKDSACFAFAQHATTAILLLNAGCSEDSLHSLSVIVPKKKVFWV